MINFRFHLVSLVAVFLALALGIVMGSTVVQESIVDGLREQIKTVSERSDEVSDENDQLRSLLARERNAIGEIAPFAAEGRLADTEVVVLAERSADATSVRDFVDLAGQGGGTVPAIIWLEATLALDDEETLATTVEALDLPSDTEAEAARAAVYGVLAERFDAGGDDGTDGTDGADGDDDTPPASAGSGTTSATSATTSPPTTSPPTTIAPDDDVLGTLEGLGLIDVESVGDAELGAFPQSSPTVYALGAAAVEDDPVDLFEVSIAFDERALLVVAGEIWSDQAGNAARGGAVREIIGDALGDRVATVDDLDLEEGRIAAVIAGQELVSGTVGHYGLGDGAGSPFPEWSGE